MNLKHKVFLFDVNHTLINTGMGHIYAMKSMEESLVKSGIEQQKANKIVKHVHYITSLMIADFLIVNEEEWEDVPGGRDAYREVFFKIKMHQRAIYDQWGFIKKWSREVFVKIAADYSGVNIDNKKIKKAVDAHWNALTKKAKPFESAKVLFKELNKRNIPCYLLTSSDGRLQFGSEGFFYDPDYSEELKRKRMLRLKKEGLNFRDIVIGDPYDKPLKEYFERGIEKVKKDLDKDVGKNDLVMVGNSLEDDLHVPINNLGFGLGILVDERKESIQINESIIRIKDLREIIDLL